MKEMSEAYCKAQAQQVAFALIDESRAYTVTPYPFDVYQITTIDGRSLPEPLAPNDAGQQVGFSEWILGVEKGFGESLCQDLREIYNGYFLRGITPREAMIVDFEERLMVESEVAA